MRKGSSGPGPALPLGGTDGEATRTFLSRNPGSRPRPDNPANPSPHPPTDVVPAHAPTDVGPAHAPTDVVPAHAPTDVGPGDAALARGPGEIVRYGPGVPATPAAGQAQLTAERVWHASRPATPARRTARLRRLAGSALTVILLAASGITLYLRFHHAPFRVSGVVISQQAPTGCGVDVTGRITTDGSAGTVSYQWLFRPDLQPPQPLSQSVIAGQRDVYVTAAIQGTDHGSALETVILQVLGPELATASAAVLVSCR